jgi:hypothetical protein
VPEPDADPAPAPLPFLRVEAGRPTPEELAAVVVAVHTLTEPPDGAPTGDDSASAWSDRHRAMRAALRTPAMSFAPGPEAWRASAWPG